MINYQKLRITLDSSPRHEWDQILEFAIETHESKVNELPGDVMGYAVSDVVVEDGLVTASVYYLMKGTSYANEDGPYQDGDGESYDQEESEYTFAIYISPDGTKWESA